ncbi:MAG: hypothetical protein E7255_16280 [Lachnospiraceae bacterium]|nr:hypothetical protein [Lachnospiraceae bacterium]
MLKKLLKHELKATSRYLVPLFLVLFLFTILNKITLGLDIFKGLFKIIPGITFTGYVLSLIAIVVVTFVILVIRFYKNLTSEEGYLMFTIPAKSNQLVNSKLLIAMLWTILSILAVILSLFFLFMKEINLGLFLGSIREMWEEITLVFHGNAILLAVEMIVTAILSLINTLLQIYVSIAIGQLFNGHKLIGSFGAYIGINLVLQILFTTAIVVSGVVFHSFNDLKYTTTLFFPILIVVILVINGIYYGVTNYLFTNKLNLE